jgi:D-3-phosphoglycerate dehydrogenase / 2-oxoglutarate reductase
MKKILITGDLFIFLEHENMLRDAGFEFERLKLSGNPNSEEELCKAIKGKHGYILGGIEQVSAKVIDAANQLEAIVFTGAGYKRFIPAWKYATQKGIAISNVPDGPTQAVAEWALSSALVMNRGFFALGGENEQTFITTSGLENTTIGIIGLGRIGSRIAEMVQVFNPRQILYHSRHRYIDKEKLANLIYEEDISKLLQKSDIIFLCVSDDAGKNFFTDKDFANMKEGPLLVSFAHPGIINTNALFHALQAGKIRAISDYQMDPRFQSFPRSIWFSFKESNAFNTTSSLQYTSTKAIHSIINLITKGRDDNLVNPQYLQNKSKS